ncbi:hypothetical protein JCM33374_g3105 [Metschnikowia sp. JCM 33374]|nr:hypothetical protein JCM33374_g3105 [Metschnikowia sp. JCM 33374]
MEQIPSDLAEHEWDSERMKTYDEFKEWFSKKYFMESEDKRRSVFKRLGQLQTNKDLPKTVMEIGDIWELNQISSNQVTEDEFKQRLINIIRIPAWQDQLLAMPKFEDMLTWLNTMADARTSFLKPGAPNSRQPNNGAGQGNPNGQGQTYPKKQKVPKHT